MRSLLFLAGMSGLLTGCVADRDMPFREARYKTSESAQASGVLTPQVGKECLERLEAKLPQVRIVGSFSVEPSLVARVPVKHTILPSREYDNLVVLAAPSISTGIFGEVKTM